MYSQHNVSMAFTKCAFPLYLVSTDFIFFVFRTRGTRFWVIAAHSINTCWTNPSRCHGFRFTLQTPSSGPWDRSAATAKLFTIQMTKLMDHHGPWWWLCCCQMVSLHAFYLEDVSSKPAEVCSFYSVKLFEKVKKMA